MPRRIRPKRPNAKKRAAAAHKKGAAAGGLRGWFSHWRDATRRAQARDESSARAQSSKTAGAVVVHLKPLSLLKGKDGLFRGAPDPTLIVAAYALRPTATKTVLRAALRFRVKGRAPVVAPPDVDHLVSSQLKNAKVVVFVVALFEENSGADIRALAAALEDPEGLHLVNLSSKTDASPKVMTVRECSQDPELTELSPRGIVVAAGDASRTSSDTWVGGGALVVKKGGVHRHRLNVASVDGEQDWTVEFETSWR